MALEYSENMRLAQEIMFNRVACGATRNIRDKMSKSRKKNGFCAQCASRIKGSPKLPLIVVNYPIREEMPERRLSQTAKNRSETEYCFSRIVIQSLSRSTRMAD